MKKYALGILLFIKMAAFSQETGINFKEGTWQEALASAKQTEKPLFVYVYGTVCHFCRIMEKTVFTDKDVNLYYNTTFVDYKINLDEEQGKALGKKFHISRTPTYLYFDEKGMLIHISSGEKPAPEFIQDGKNALDSNSAYTSLKNRYYRGDHSSSSLYNFSSLLLNVTDSPDIRNEVVDAYLKTQDSDLSSKKNLEYISTQALSVNDPATRYFFEMQKPLIELFGAETIQKHTISMVRNSAFEAAYQNDSAQLNQIKNVIKASNLETSEQLINLADIQLHMAGFMKEHGQWKPYADAALSYGKKYTSTETYTLRYMATLFYYYVDEKEGLQKALQAITQVIAKEKNYDNFLLQAKLLHKLGQEKQAAIAVNSAIQAATVEDDIQDAKDLLQEIKDHQKK